MTKEDKTKFAEIMMALALNCNVRLQAETIKLYFKALNNFTIQQVSDAAQKILLSWKYPNTFPPLAIFIDHIQGPKEEIEDRALREAHKIIAHLNEFGATKFPLLDDPITKYLMTKRWPYSRWAADITVAENKWWIKEFVKSYTAYSQDSSNFPSELPHDIKQLAGNLFEKIH
jgi:hypothetical protein